MLAQTVDAIKAHIRENGLQVGDLPFQRRLPNSLCVARHRARGLSLASALTLDRHWQWPPPACHRAQGRRAGAGHRPCHACSDQVTIQQIFDVRRTVERRTACAGRDAPHRSGGRADRRAGAGDAARLRQSAAGDGTWLTLTSAIAAASRNYVRADRGVVPDHHPPHLAHRLGQPRRQRRGRKASTVT